MALDPEAMARMGGTDPEFAEKLRKVMERLSEQGFQPRVSNAFRTPEQQAEKVRLGYAKNPDPGTHGAGLAADVIDKRYGWEDSKRNAKFFAALTDAAMAEGLTAGGSWFGQGGTRLKPTRPALWNKYGIGWDPAHIESKTPVPQAARAERGGKMAGMPDAGVGPGTRPEWLPADTSLDKLNTIISGLETRVSAEEDNTTRNTLMAQLEAAKRYRLNFSGPHQPPGGTVNPPSNEPISLNPPVKVLPLETGYKRLPGKTAAPPSTGAPVAAPFAADVPKITLGAQGRSVSTTSGVPYPAEDLARREELGGTMLGEQLKLANARRERLQKIAEKRIGLLDEADKTIARFSQSAQDDLDRLTGLAGGKPVLGLPPGAVEEPGMTSAAQRARAGLKGGEVEKPAVPEARKGLIAKMEERFNEAGAQLDAARKDLADFKLDPQRGVGIQVVIAGIADAMRIMGSSIASGGRNLGSGPSYVSQVLDRNLQAQKIELEKMMKIHGMTKEQRDFTWKAWNEFKDEKKAIELRMAQLDAARLANMTSRIDIKAAAAEEINKMGRDLSALRYATGVGQVEAEIKAKEKAAGKTTTEVSETRKEAVNPLAVAQAKAQVGGGKIMPPATIRNLAEDRSVIYAAMAMANKIRNKDLTPIKGIPWLPTDANTLMPQIKSLARQIERRLGTDSGNLAQQEGQLMVESVTGREWNKAAQAHRRFLEIVGRLRRKYDEEVGMYGSQGYRTTGLGLPEDALKRFDFEAKKKITE
jgi:hypothetical protein